MPTRVIRLGHGSRPPWPTGKRFACDASHQALDAHLLGLQEHTRNVLHKFAVNISDSRDWCSFWEINRYDQPAPVDYHNDRDFWYNLPDDFDVLNACYRMYLWSHDDTYLQDAGFVEFHRRAVTDYVTRWDLTLDKITGRERVMDTGDPNRTGTRRFVYFAGVLMKTFWQHTSGDVYAVESNSFGHIVGAAGPLPLDKLRDPGEYNYHRGLVAWIQRAIAQRQLHRINPTVTRR